MGHEFSPGNREWDRRNLKKLMKIYAKSLLILEQFTVANRSIVG